MSASTLDGADRREDEGGGTETIRLQVFQEQQQQQTTQASPDQCEESNKTRKLDQNGAKEEEEDEDEEEDEEDDEDEDERKEITNNEDENSYSSAYRVAQQNRKSLDAFVKHVAQQLQQQRQRHFERRSSLPLDAIELPTLNGVVLRRKQQLQARYQQQQQYASQKHLLHIGTTPSSANTTKGGRPLSISSISSAASSGSSSSANSSATSSQSSTCQRSLQNHRHHLSTERSYSQIRPNRASAKLQPSPSSVSSHSNTSSLFRDDGFEDDLTSTASENLSTTSISTSSSSAYNHHHARNHLHHAHNNTIINSHHHHHHHHHHHQPGYLDSNLSLTQRVVTEIIGTEQTYVNDLEQIVTGYICYLRNVLKKEKQQQQQHLKQSQKSINLGPTDSNNEDKVNARHQHVEEGSGQFIDPNLMVNNSSNNNSGSGDENNRATVGVNGEDGDKSVFDDDNTSAINEVDDYDVEDGDIDPMAIIRDNNDELSPLSSSSEQLKKHENAFSGCQTLDGAVITAAHIKNLFSNLEDIYKFSKDLLFRLEECYLNPGSVAECFVENASGFEVYTHYCTNYPKVVSTLTELMNNQAAAQSLKERQQALNQSLPLGAYLLKPVQRILKYHILFQSLIKHTSDDDTVSEKDRQLISEAFASMTNIACHINAMKKRHEHAIRVQEVQGLLCGWEGPDLTTLGELILEDTFKLYNRSKSNRHLFLFESLLLITKKKLDGSLCYKGHIACSNLMLIENIEGQPLVFNTVPFDNPKALCAFQAKNLDKKRDWCLQMKEVIIKSFEVEIPGHVRDILMSLTNSSNPSDASSKSESARALRAPNYLEKKRTRQDKKK